MTVDFGVVVGDGIEHPSEPHALETRDGVGGIEVGWRSTGISAEGLSARYTARRAYPVEGTLAFDPVLELWDESPPTCVEGPSEPAHLHQTTWLAVGPALEHGDYLVLALDLFVERPRRSPRGQEASLHREFAVDLQWP